MRDGGRFVVGVVVPDLEGVLLGVSLPLLLTLGMDLLRLLASSWPLPLSVLLSLLCSGEEDLGM